jgi:hypothetical protein
MYPFSFIVAGERNSMLYMHQASGVSHIMDLLLQAHVLFWLQMLIVVVGTTWCMALASILCFGGWYARMHPTTGNDRVIRRLTRLLWFLTFGLTDRPSDPVESLGNSQEGEHSQDKMPSSSGPFSHS